MDILSHQQNAWDQQVQDACMWTVPVTSEQVNAARQGDWRIILTPTVPVPRDWFPADLHGVDVLCLASGGGQQGPILAAAGANVTVFDNSPKQLAQDRMVAERDGLTIAALQGDMADLSVFGDASFDLVINPVSTVFVPDVKPVWRECGRVLRTGGALLTGFAQPHVYCLDEKEGRLVVRFALPYSDLTSIDPQERAQKFGENSPYEFSHTLTDQIGGQMAAGLVLTGLYEDYDLDGLIPNFMPSYLATRAVKISAMAQHA